MTLAARLRQGTSPCSPGCGWRDKRITSLRDRPVRMAARDLNCLLRPLRESMGSRSATSTNTQREISSNSMLDMLWRKAMRATGRRMRTISSTRAFCSIGLFGAAAMTDSLSNRTSPARHPDSCPVSWIYTSAGGSGSACLRRYFWDYMSKNFLGCETHVQLPASQCDAEWQGNSSGEKRSRIQQQVTNACLSIRMYARLRGRISHTKNLRRKKYRMSRA